MNKKNIGLQQIQPVLDITQRTQADLLAELSEDNMGSIIAGAMSIRAGDINHGDVIAERPINSLSSTIDLSSVY